MINRCSRWVFSAGQDVSTWLCAPSHTSTECIKKFCSHRLSLLDNFGITSNADAGSLFRKKIPSDPLNPCMKKSSPLNYMSRFSKRMQLEFQSKTIQQKRLNRAQLLLQHSKILSGMLLCGPNKHMHNCVWLLAQSIKSAYQITWLADHEDSGSFIVKRVYVSYKINMF